MILIPEIDTVVILVPRTGSGALKRAILEKYPKAMMVYRHMEADGVPRGYDRWQRFGIVRDPIERLWSLYKFMRKYGLDWPRESFYANKLRRSVERPFSDWIVNNDVIFTNPYSSEGGEVFYPEFNVNHSLPENRKSQFLYLRPDLGTEVVRYHEANLLHDFLGVQPKLTNASEPEPLPELTQEARDYCQRQFSWDFMAADRGRG